MLSNNSQLFMMEFPARGLNPADFDCAPNTAPTFPKPKSHRLKSMNPEPVSTKNSIVPAPDAVPTETSPSGETSLTAVVEGALASKADLLAKKNPQDVAKSETEEEAAEKQTATLKKDAEQLDATLEQQRKRRLIIKELLEATGGNVPAMFEEVNQELKALMGADKFLSLSDKLDFTDDSTAFRVPSFSSSLALDGSTDFFGMSVSDQKLLYDQIGLFKGIVVDHSKETPVEQGYRDVLKYEATKNGSKRTRPTRAFYKKPRLSGFFESTYSLDETQQKTNEAGIFNLGFGLSASYSSLFTSAAVKAGFSYGKDYQEEQALQRKKVAITSSFFLPKIELSFDTLYPCASDDFTGAVDNVFTLPREEQFDRLIGLLRHFGHFVATSLVIGGRLYSTDEKQVDSSSSMSNQLTKYSANFQASVSVARFEGGMEGKTDKQDSEKRASSSTREHQNLQLRAVGGEGAYVNNMSQWVESLAKFNAWGLVRFDNLVPSLQILPADLQLKCHNLLSEVIASPTMSIETLVAKNAHFLFYQGYLEPYGSKASPRYFVLKNSGSDQKVLTVEDGRRFNEADVALKTYEDLVYQDWWRSPDGKIYSRNDRDDMERYVLSIAQGSTNKNQLVVTQEDYFPNQRWVLAGGFLKNEDTGIYVEINTDDVLTFAEKVPTRNSRNVWQALTEDQLLRLREAQPRKEPQKAKGKHVSLLSDGQYIEKGQQLISSASNARLEIHANQLRIIHEATAEAPLWTWSTGSDEAVTIERLYLANGSLYVVDNAQKTHSLYGLGQASFQKPASSLQLLDNGNLELVNRNDQPIWESDSILYSTLVCGEGVLSTHHLDYEPSMSFDDIRVTTMPFVGADHQLWYQNRNRQLICKARRDGMTKMALESSPDGSKLQVKPVAFGQKTQHWDVGTSINNVANSKYLTPTASGQLTVLSDSSGSGWEMVLQPAYRSGINVPIRVVKAPLIGADSDEEGYRHFDYYHNWLHLSLVSLLRTDGRLGELRGIQLYRHEGSRLAIRAIFSDSVAENGPRNNDSVFGEFDRNNVYFDKAPVYLPSDVERIGFYKKADSFAFKAMKAGTDYVNKQEGERIKMMQGDHNMHLFDTTRVMADSEDRVVGFGFTHHSDRITPYLLVVKKQW